MQQEVLEALALKGKIDVGLVTIRRDEAQAVLRRLPFAAEIRGRERTYDFARLPIGGGDTLQVAHLCCRDQGPREAHLTTAQLLEDLAPRWVVLTGIAGTVPNEDVCLGDVVVSSHLYDMRLSVNKPGGERAYAVRPGDLHAAARDLVARLPSVELRMKDWHARLLPDWPRPALAAQAPRLVGDAPWQRKVEQALQFHFGESSGRPRHPVVHAVPFVSGSELTKSPEAVQSWLHAARDAKAIEMELVGALEACVQRYEGNDVPLLSVRGISDVVGLERDQRLWTPYACEAAAAFLAAWLDSGSFLGGPMRRGPVALPAKTNGTTAPEEEASTRSLLALGSWAVTPKSVSQTRVPPGDLFDKLARDARSKGRKRIVVGWNVRPVQHLGLIHVAYLQQLSRLARWGFKIKISIFDVCTSEPYSPNEMDALLDGFERQLTRFEGIGPTSLGRVGRKLRRRPASEVVQAMFRLARPSLGQHNTSANDPATSLDNLLCLAVEGWEQYDLLLAGGRDANDFWAQYRTRLQQKGVVADGLSLLLDFPKLHFGAVSAPERLEAIPHCGDSVEQVEAKLRDLDAAHYDGIWNCLLAPCGRYVRPSQWDAARLAQDVFDCFHRSPFLVR